ncbi:B3 domain-containing protein [Senna tora]|uniref:B3 domain-containing protein n=1 Tax=Senna tora TaxID=362788 RepID=A0A835CCR8_9FABA|nr:B3 domain-containing protein [Senna tora]
MKELVCVKCAQKCLSLHGKKKKKNSSNVPSSFFKVMLGREFSTVLYLPPKFGPTASALVYKKAIIEDCSGQQWEVIVSKVNKCFAFKEGWNGFSTDHGLVVGDFLVFDYIGSSHFIVKIYDKSGCEMLDFPTRRKPKKRSRSRADLDARDDMLNTADVERTETQHKGVDVERSRTIKENNTSEKNNSHGKVQFLEDPYCMTERDFGEKERDDRSSMFDVLSFEILNNSGVDRGTGQFTTGNEIVDASIFNKDPLLEDILGREPTQDPNELELTERSHFLEEIDKRAYVSDRHSCGAQTSEQLLVTYNVQYEENRQKSSTVFNREVQEYKFADVSETDAVGISKERQRHFGNCQNSQQMINKSSDAPIHHGFSKVFLGEAAQSSQTTIKDHGSLLNSVKPEPIYYANMPAFVLPMKGENGEKNGAPSGSTEDTVTDPLP